MAEPTDEELMASFQGGDGEAFQELYRRHAGRVQSYLRKRGARSHEEDLLQEVWLKVYRSRSSFVPGFGLFRAWLYSIARNVCIDFCRTQRVTFVEFTGQEANPSPATPPLDLEQLSEAERKILELHFNEGRTFREIAEQLGKQPSTIRQISHRAIIRLRKLFQGASS